MDFHHRLLIRNGISVVYSRYPISDILAPADIRYIGFTFSQPIAPVYGTSDIRYFNRYYFDQYQYPIFTDKLIYRLSYMPSLLLIVNLVIASDEKPSFFHFLGDDGSTEHTWTSNERHLDTWVIGNRLWSYLNPAGCKSIHFFLSSPIS